MSGWEPVLTDLVHERGGALIRYATLLCGNSRDGEDLVQDALIRVFTVIRRPAEGVDIDAIEHAEAYVRRTILNLYLDGYRRSRRWVAVRHLVGRSDATVGPEQVSPQQMDLLRALGTLPPRQRACVVLRFYDDLSVDQIAAQLGVTAGAVKRHLHDANAHLASTLAPATESEQP